MGGKLESTKRVQATVKTLIIGGAIVTKEHMALLGDSAERFRKTITPLLDDMLIDAIESPNKEFAAKLGELKRLLLAGNEARRRLSELPVATLALGITVSLLLLGYLVYQYKRRHVS